MRSPQVCSSAHARLCALALVAIVAATARASFADTAAFGPQTFTQTVQSGQPPLRATFTVSAPSGPYILRVVSLSASNATVSVNGPAVVAPTAFLAAANTSGFPFVLKRQITLRDGANEVRVDLRTGTGASLTVQILKDTTPPTITAAATPQPGANGWHQGDVTVTFSCSDTLSSVASCPARTVVSGEGAGQLISGTATDNSGNSAMASVTLNIDKTAPTLTPMADGQMTASSVMVAGVANDAQSGIASLTCNGEPVTRQPDGSFSHGPLALVDGSNTFTLVAADVAGHTTQRYVHITKQCVNLLQDPGFEAGISGFTAQDASSAVTQSSEAPLEGAHSLRASITGYGNNLWWVYDFSGGKASRWKVSAHLRSDVASTSDLQFCGMVYYADGSTALTCTPVSGAPGDKGIISAVVDLNPAKALESVRIRLIQEGGAPVQFSLDGAVACLDVVSNPPDGPPPPPPPPPPPDDEEDPDDPPPGPSAYPGFTYTLPTVRPFISLDAWAQVNPASTTFARFKRAADDAVAGNPPYAYSATHSVLIFRLTGQLQYIDDAIARVEAQVAEAEAEIAAGHAPPIAGDSYLEVGWYIEQLALTYDYGFARLSDTQRQRWAGYTEQVLYNVWHPNQATWGGVPRPWSGWSINDPGNNYHYSFLRGTMLWALASQNAAWFDFLQTRKFGPLTDYFVALPGGGSREGTGYGTAQKNLFENYIYWKASTGEDLAALSSHTKDTIDYWVHATVPTLDRFAPIGDQSRSSIPELYDYHENLVHAAVVLSAGTDQARRGTWWLQHNSVNGVANSFNLAGDLLPLADTPAAPTSLVYHAQAAGHFFARSGWDTEASWLSLVAGKYDQSHAHQDQGAFTFFKRDWLAVTSNIWSHSGINQDTDAHNVVRFVRNGTTIPQTPSSSRRSSMTYTENAGVVSVEANLTNAYWNSGGAVQSWNRQLDFQGDVLRVHDSCSVASNVQPIFQLHVPVLPVVQPDGSIQAGGLHVTSMQPVTVTIVSMTGAEYTQGYRIELTAASGCGFDVELQGQ